MAVARSLSSSPPTSSNTMTKTMILRPTSSSSSSSSSSSPRNNANNNMKRMTTYTLILLLLATSIFSITLLSLFSSISSSHHHHRGVVATTTTTAVSRALNQFQQRQENDIPIITNINYPIEDPIPNPPGEMPNGHDTFAACLLVMDDNHRLPEWFAYHYHVLPLRYVVVTVDPRSKTSPTHIFNQWRRQGVHIVQWKDSDYWKKSLKLKAIPDDAKLQMKRDRHRGRQKFFYRSCLTHMKSMNRTWVSLHDSDEYLVYNHPGGDEFKPWQDKLERRVASLRDNAKSKKINILQPSQTPPTVADEGAMIKYIRQEQAAGIQFYQSPCIGIPRLMFGAEESPHAIKSQQVPQPFDVDQFDTLRFRKHARRNDFVKNALGKVIIDVSRVDMKKAPYFESLHRPIKTICPPPWHNDWESGLRINHYLGTWESYSFRDDSRRGNERSREQWEYKATTNGDGGDDDIIRPWLDGFVQYNGIDRASELLQHAGLPKGYRNVNSTAWYLSRDKLDAILNTTKNSDYTNDNKRLAFDEWVRGRYYNDGNNKERRRRRG